jgi:tripartite-type tricarboxylate transporter receptor subunit TctC
VVENKPGAEGVIGVQAAKSAPPDGYTIMMTSNSTQVLNVLMLRKIPYDPVADFVPLVGAGTIPVVMYVGAASPFKTAQEFVAAARANPGKYTFGSFSTTGRMAVEMLEQYGGIKLLPVPYKTQSEVLTAVSSGELDMAFATVLSANAFNNSGRIRALGVSSTSRLKDLPNVPTLREQGLPNYSFTSWLATYAPAKTPPAISSALLDILQKASRTTVVQEALAKYGIDPLNLSGEQLTAMQRAEVEKWGKLVRSQRP